MNEKDKKGQMGLGLVWGIVGLTVTLLVFMAFLPVISDSFNDARDSDVLNCKSNDFICGTTVNSTGDGVWCYNSTLPTEATACTFMALGTPLIVIFVILGAIGAMMTARAITPIEPAYTEGY